LELMGENSRETLDAEAMEIRSSVRQGLFGEDAPMKIGRFDVVSRLGRGGMGIVYEGYDPQLDRRLAIKVMRAPAFALEADPKRAQRLLREAQATAKLSHPNVVTVYEVGSIGDSVYMAMEYVDGQTLRQWSRYKARSWKEIVEVFIQAGRGLVHAHGAGLVHRDFKPDNVMIDAEGRVRVLDFGLARLTGVEVSVDTVTTEEKSPSVDMLTVTGMVLGTPAYMAPEQRRSRSAVAASDQYGFCVTLHEALYGRRPPHPDDDDPPSTNIERVGPAALRRIIERGLEIEPQDRFASMAVLVARLEALVGSRRWALALGGVGALSLAALMWPGAAATSEEEEEPCVDHAAQAAAVWNDERRDALAEHFDRVPRAFAEDVWPRIARDVDARVQAWTAASEQSCRATRVEGTQSEDVRLWRSLCLGAQLRRLDALLGVLQRGNETTLVQASTSIAALDEAAMCSADRAGRSHVVWPSDPNTIEKLQALELELAIASAERNTLRYEEGIAQAKAVAASAAELQFPPLVAQALRVQADLEIRAGRPAEAEATLTAAIEEAEAGHDDEGVARAWIALVHVVGEELARIDEAKRMFPLVKGAVVRAGNPGHLRGRWLSNKAIVHDIAGEFDESVALFEEALEIDERTYGADHPLVARTLHGLARALRNRGDVAESLAYTQRAKEIAEARFGPRHPEVATQLTAIGSAHGALGEHEQASAAFDLALTILRDALGPDHARVGAAHHNLGASYLQAKRDDEAVPHFERAIAIDRATLGEDHPHRVPALYGLAMVHLTQDDHDAAQSLFSEGLEILERAWGRTHPDLSYVLVGLGRVAAARGDHELAIEHYERVLSILEPAIGSDHPRLVAAQVELAESLLAQERPEQALEAYEAALAIVGRGRNEPAQAAEVEFGVAETLVVLGRDRARAITLAESARDGLAGAGAGFAERAAEIAAWVERVK